MATTAAPYGLLPINLIGGQSFTGGSIRDYAMKAPRGSIFYLGFLVPYLLLLFRRGSFEDGVPCAPTPWVSNLPRTM